MAVELTKDADRLICLIYKEFLSRRESGISKGIAKDFGDPERWPASFLQEMQREDISDTLPELKKVGIIKLYINSGFRLEDSGIIYMEQRFPKGVAQVLDWLGKVKSAIPFV